MYFSLKAQRDINKILENPDNIAYDRPRKLSAPKTMTGATTPIMQPKT